jgi:peptidoglycan/xylan/chitin deacetylase (PgdA/CDA1 family)
LSTAAPWPEGRPFAVALSHDVDRVAKRGQFAYYIPLSLARGRWQTLRQHMASLRATLAGRDPFWSFPMLMELEDSLSVRSTFFVLNETGKVRLTNPRSWMLYTGRYKVRAPQIEQVLRQLHAGGWEIGLHGSYKSFEDEQLLHWEKQELEAAAGVTVVGGRQHYLNLLVPETWEAHARIGLKYDSTLGFTRRIGLRWGSSRPFFPQNPRTGAVIPVLQIPMAIMDGPLMALQRPQPAVEALIEQVEQEHGVLTINFHSQYFNTYEHLGWMEMYRELVMRCQARGAWFAPLRDIAALWLAGSQQVTADQVPR